jgi:hypothetical protein
MLSEDFLLRPYNHHGSVALAGIWRVKNLEKIGATTVQMT